jgi:hypothetical protein
MEQKKNSKSCVSIMLTDNQIAFMDEVAAKIRRHTGSAVKRSAITRAILDACLRYANDEGDVVGQVRFIEQTFEIAA